MTHGKRRKKIVFYYNRLLKQSILIVLNIKKEKHFISSITHFKSDVSAHKNYAKNGNIFWLSANGFDTFGLARLIAVKYIPPQT